MSRNPGHSLLVVTAILLGFVAIFFLSSFLEKNRVSMPADYDDSDLELQGKRLKGYALGAEGLIADWYWMRSLQYIGNKLIKSENGLSGIDDLRPLNPRLLYPMLDNATTLDPKMMAAYSYGAIMLPAIDPQQAIALTERGIENNPDQWRLHQYLGYIYWKLNDFDKAAEVYERGSRFPGAPIFFKLMAAKMKVEGGSRDTARTIYSQMLVEAQDEQTKKTAELRLKQIESLDELDVINPVMQAYKEKNGQCEVTWPELINPLQTAANKSKRTLRIDASRNLVDPTGVPYRINREKCEAEIDWPKSKIPIV